MNGDFGESVHDHSSYINSYRNVTRYWCNRSWRD